MAIVIAIGNTTQIYKISKAGKKYQYSCISSVDVSAQQVGEYNAGMMIIDEIMNIQDYLNEKYYCLLTDGSNVMYKTINIPLGSLDIDPAETKNDDEYQLALAGLKDKYILSGYDPNDYEVIILNYIALGANAYITLAFAPQKLINGIIYLCKHNDLDLISINTEIKLLKKIIFCDANEYFIAQNHAFTLINDIGLLILNGQYPADLARKFLSEEAHRTFETSYVEGPTISAANIGQYLLIDTVAAEDHSYKEYDNPLETAAAITAAYEDELDKFRVSGNMTAASNDADERQVKTDGVIGKIKRLFTKK